MKSIIVFSVILSTLFLISCDREESFEQQCEGGVPGKINIRVMNLSAFEVQNLSYQQAQTISSLNPGETTEYMQFDFAYSSPSSIEMTIEGQEKRSFLIDNLGLTQLEPGCYTYLLFAVEYGEERDIFSGGAVYDNALLSDINTEAQNCPQLETSVCDTVSNKANIRVKNSTAFDMCNIVIDMTSLDRVIYGDLASGETSCYIPLTIAKLYPLQCTFKLGGEDYLIENPTYHARLDDLPNGLYTYNIYTIRTQDKLGDIQLSND